MKKILFPAVLFVLAACSPAPKKASAGAVDSAAENTPAEFNPESFRSDLQKEETELCRLIVAHNDSLALYYDENASVCPPDTTFFKGKTGILRYWKTVFLPTELSRSIISLDGTKDLFYETGIESGKSGDNRILNFKYLIIWKRRHDGSYKIAYEMWNRIGS